MTDAQNVSRMLLFNVSGKDEVEVKVKISLLQAMEAHRVARG
jgi:hypothetical protein